MVNKGKEFELDFRESCKLDGLFVLRLNDSSMSWQHERFSKFTCENPCDFLMYKNPQLFAIECKSSKYPSITFQKSEDDNEAMIKYHQIKSLTDFSKQGLVCGLLLNFRDDENLDNNIVYWLPIDGFNNFLLSTTKKSINKLDCVQYGAIVVKQRLKRTRFIYSINEMIDLINKCNLI